MALLALIAIALGATSVAYNVLDRPAVTALGVLVTFALLVQFGGFLAELSEQERRGRPGDTRLRHAVAVQPRRFVELARRLGARRRDVPRLVPARSSTAGAPSSSAGRSWPRCRSFSGRPTSSTSWPASTAVHGATRLRATSRRSRSPRDSPRWPRSRSSSRRATSATSRRGVFAAYGWSPRRWPRVSRWFVRLVPEAGGGPDDGRRRVLVVGAGQAGRGIVRDLRGAADVHVVGFLDDNPRLRRRRDAGRPRARDDGRRAEVALEATRADELVVTIPDAPADRLERVAQRAATPPVSHTASSASARSRHRRRERSSSERAGDGSAARRGEREGERSRARRGARPARRRLPLPRDGLRVAGVEARDADDLHRRARDDPDLACDRGDRSGRTPRRGLRLLEPRPLAHGAVLVARTPSRAPTSRSRPSRRS